MACQHKVVFYIWDGFGYGFGAMKPRYFKMDDVSYPLRLLHRYLPDTSRYFPIRIRRVSKN